MYRILYRLTAKPFSPVQHKMFRTTFGVLGLFLIVFIILMIVQHSTVSKILREPSASFETSVECLIKEQRALLMNRLRDTLWLQLLIRAETESPTRPVGLVSPGMFLRIYDEKRRLLNLFSESQPHIATALTADDFNQLDEQTPLFFYRKTDGEWNETAAARMAFSDGRGTSSSGSEKYFYISVSHRFDSEYLKKLSLISGSRVLTTEPDAPYENEPEEMIVVWPMKNSKREKIGELRWIRDNPIGSADHALVLFFYWLLFGMALSTMTVIILLSRTRIIRPLYIITEALRNNDLKRLPTLTERNDEFGIIARLIEEHHQQKEQLNMEIQERQKAEAEAVRRESLIRVFFSASTVCIALLQNEQIREVNDAFCRMVGYSPDEITGKNFDDFFTDKEVYTQQQYAVKKSLRQSGICHFETLWRKKDGTILNVFISYSVAPIANTVSDIIINVFDITDRKAAEAAIHESENKYRTLVNHIGEGIIILNTQKRFVFANPGAASIFGLPETELIGEPINRFLTQDMYERLHAHSPLHYEGQKTTLEIEIIRTDHETRHLLMTITPQTDAEGHYSGSFAVLLDISERKKRWMPCGIAKNHSNKSPIICLIWSADSMQTAG